MATDAIIHNDLRTGFLGLGCLRVAFFEESTYRQVNAEEADSMMEEESGYIILDVRTAQEYSEKHIPGAINIPNETIGDQDIPELPDKEQLILKVWGYDSAAEDNNVEVYISFLRRKLTHLQSTVKIKTLRMVGYCLEVEA